MFPYQNILKLPVRSLLHKRLTKAFFLKNFKLSSAEKKLLNNTIVAMEFLASLKTQSINTPAVLNDQYTYEEILIISIKLDDNLLDTKGNQCIAFIQKYIPYHILLFVEDEFDFVVNTCHKNINQNDASKRTIASSHTSPKLSKLYQTDISKAFFENIAFEKLDKTNLETLYKNYTQTIVQLQTAQHTGSFKLRTKKRTAQDLQNIEKIEQLENEIISLASQIKKADQLNQKVQLNVQIQELKKEIQALKQLLMINA